MFSGLLSARETEAELSWAADSRPCVEKLRTVLPFTVGIRDGAVQLVSILGGVVISARAGLGSIITSALPVVEWARERNNDEVFQRYLQTKPVLRLITWLRGTSHQLPVR
jgi:hypothetical protein